MAVPTIQELYDLSGRVALVTGGARGLGYEMAVGLAEAGAGVALTSRDLAAAQGSAGRIAGQTGRTVHGFACDVRAEDQVQALVEAVLATCGRIDILVNNAGNVWATPETAALEQRPLADWQLTLDVNLNGTFLVTKHVVSKAMKPQRAGAIINVASASGMVGKDRRVYEGLNIGGVTLDYCTAKGGLINMTRDLAGYLAQYNIRVNCISPGAFERGQSERFAALYNKDVPLGRMGLEQTEIKGPICFLASQAASYITGANIPVDGGRTAW